MKKYVIVLYMKQMHLIISIHSKMIYHQGTCIKATWTKPKGVGLRMGGGDRWGRGPRGVKMETAVHK